MPNYDDTPRPLSKSALWASICGLAALAMTALTIYLCFSRLLRGLVGISLLLQIGLGIAAIVLGHIGIPMSSRARGRRGRARAITGMVMGYAQLVFIVFLLPAIAVPQYLDMQDSARLRIQEGGIASAMGTCDLTLGEALMDGKEFSCAKAQENLPPSSGLTVIIVENGPRSCLITATANGSGTPTTDVWMYMVE